MNYLIDMRKEIVIASSLNETRIAITENGELSELFVEVPDKERYVGNVYMGRVEKIIQGMNAAFIDIGLPQGAFLHFSDVDSSLEESFFTEDEDDDDTSKDVLDQPHESFIKIDYSEPSSLFVPPSDIAEADLSELLSALLMQPTVGKPAGYNEILAKELLEQNEIESEQAHSTINASMSDSAAIALRLKKMPPKQNVNAKPLPTFSTKRSGLISINLQPKQTIIVQVVREGYSSKGVRVTTKVALPGRYMVLLPFDNLIGVSRKIGSVKERKRLRQLAKSLIQPGIGCIVRTAAEDKTDQELSRDWAALVEQWKEMENNVKIAKAPSLLYKDKNITGSVIRDLFTEEVERVVIDSPKLYKEITSYLHWVAPELSAKVEMYQGRKALFDYFKLEKSIQETYARKVYLPSGGSIVIDQTEAMHVVDVNSGRSTSEHEQEKSAFRNNMEALKAVAKQLRLRDIGGMIIIDFIDMMLEENRKKLYNEMRRELSKDRAKTVVYPITQLGLLQITRQRIRQAISERLTDTCNVCDGAGRIRSRSVILHSIERWLTSFRAQNLDFSVELIVHPSMAEYLTEGAISRLSKLMIKHFVKIKLDINDNINPDEFTFVSTRTFRDITSDYL